MARGKPADLHQSDALLVIVLQTVAWAHGGDQNNSRYSKCFFAIITLLCIHHIFFSASADAVEDYYSAMTISTLFFSASDYILLRHQQPELRKVGQKKPTHAMSFWERLKLSFDLTMTPRTLGWSTEPTSHICPRPTSGRLRFVCSQLAWLLYYYIMLDAATLIEQAIPIYRIGGPTFSEYGWIWRATVWSHILNMYARLSINFTILSAVTVALGLYQPEDWPHLFGSYIKDGYSVREILGKVWHQMLRKTLTGHANALVKALRLPKCNFTSYFKLYVAFGVSGLIHYAGEYTLHQDWAGQAITFFILQAVAITLEDLVIAIAKRLGHKASSYAKCVGFLWVFVWFSFSTPYWLERDFHAGSFDNWRHPPSLIKWLWSHM